MQRHERKRIRDRRQGHVVYQLVPSPMTSNDPEGYSHVAGLFKCNSANIYATLHGFKFSTDTAIRRRQLSFLYPYARPCSREDYNQVTMVHVI